MSQVPTVYLNENIAVRVALLLKNKGINSIHTLEVGNKGVSDVFQLEYAAAKGYVLVTHNRRHFQALHSSWLEEGRRHAGIIVIGCAPPERLAERIRIFFEQVYPATQASFCLSPPRLD